MAGFRSFKLLIGVIRSKFIAVLLGPAGMGIAGLLTATTGMIAALTNFGLGTSAVKSIASAHGSGDAFQIAKSATIFRRLVWLTGFWGLHITLIFSPWLSQITFGNKDFTWAFIFLSVTLLINQLSTGQSVLLQGTRKISYLAQAGIIGSILGLFTTVPLYYVYGVKGIVPGIIITSITTLFITGTLPANLK